jgi:hypothetical protein
LSKGKPKDTNRWGETHFEDITSPIERVEQLMKDFYLEDSWRVAHPRLKVGLQTQTATWAAKSTFGRDGCRLDYILVSKKEEEDKGGEASGEEFHDGGRGSGGSSAGGSPQPSAKRRKLKAPSRWFSKSEIYYGKGLWFSNGEPGSGSDHLACVLELDQ